MRRYNGPANWADHATALAVDDSGNVYVTGESWDFEAPEGLPQPTQCATIKYNSAGDVVWVSRYQTPTKNRNWPVSLAVDENGNTYLGVRSFVDFDHRDYLYEYVTIKYSPNGDTVWTRLYNGPGDNRDILASLAIDKSGNVYVTGHSEKSSDHVSVTLVTLKYNSAGETVWTRTYNGPENSDDRAQSLAVDEGGDVYVVGGSQGSGTKRDYLTIKYNSAGDSVWVSRFDGAAHDVDYPASLALDGGGGIYVTGTSYLETQAYSSSAFATVKYNSAGDTVWGRSYNAPRLISASNRATAFDLDGSGNVYITGNATGVSDISAVATVKYNAHGDTVWAKSYLGPNSIAGQPSTFTVDESGNVYVAGTTSSPTGYPPDGYIVIKHNSNGEIAWTRRYNDQANGNAWAASLAVDESGYVYVVGSSRVSDIPADYATIRYDSAGDTVWVSRYNGVWNSTDEATSLAVDHNGNVYVTGNSWSSLSSPNPTSDFATVKYNSSGDTLWARDYNGPANRSDQARVIVVDAQGNVYVTGSADLDNDIEGRTTKSDYATIKYNSAGDRLWARTYNGPGDGVDIPTALAVDGDGNPFVTGYSQDADSSYDCTTIRYSPAGDTLWVRRYHQNSTSPVFLTVDAGGNAYVTVSCGDADSSNATIKYSSSGVEEWVARYPHVANGVGIRLDEGGNVYVAGTGLAPEGPLYAVIKYVQRPTSVEGGTSAVPTTFALEQNYPNPFNPSTTIRYGLPHKSAVQLTIFNILGQQVALLQNGEQEAGYHEAKFEASGFASGMYFYRLQAGSFVETKKLLLLR